jgi:DUF4097 and DUF4098 domain-containing protein YvlB
MENRNPNRNRNTWIIAIAVVVVLLLICCLIIGGIVVLAGGLGFARVQGITPGTARVTEETQQLFDVEPGATLEVDNFAGNIRVHSGPDGQITLITRRHAGSTSDLQRIEVAISDETDRLQIRTSQAAGMIRGWSVEFEITVPADTQLDLETNAGNVEVDGVDGEILGRTGAGNVEVRDATAPVMLRTGAGNIRYEGEPTGLCTFDTAAGNITLRLPAGAEVEVDLRTGVGNIDLGAFEVDGDVARTRVTGVIGTGEDATIEADTSAGNIDLVRR